MLKLGSNSIGKIYLGSNQIGKAYLGSDLVYRSGEPAPMPEFHERVRFDGTAYIQTDILLPENGSVRVSSGGETRKGNQGVFNASNSNGNVCFCIFMTTATTEQEKTFACRYDSTNTDSSRMSYDYSIRLSLFITPSKWGFSGGAKTHSKGEAHPDREIQIGALSQGYRYTGALGYFYIYDSSAQNASDAYDLRDNYTPIYTLRPCVYNGGVGYWCVETSTFYGNSNVEGTLTVEDD